MAKLRRRNSFNVRMLRQKLTAIAALVAVSLSSLHSAHAVKCEDSFVNVSGSYSPYSYLPKELQDAFVALAPGLRQKITERFWKRDTVRASIESRQLIADLLNDRNETEVRLMPIIRPGAAGRTRIETLSEILAARSRNESARARLEERLIEIGYRRDSPGQLKRTEFQNKYFRHLEAIKRVAVNMASQMVVGYPIYLRPYQLQSFRFQPQRTADWMKAYDAVQARIDSRDPAFIRNLKIEVAGTLAIRIAAVAVLGLIADEFVELIYPDWKGMKSDAWYWVSGSRHTPREELERLAMENWKDIIEAFTGERPKDDEEQTLEMRNRILQAAERALRLHVESGAPLPETDSPEIDPERSNPESSTSPVPN